MSFFVPLSNPYSMMLNNQLMNPVQSRTNIPLILKVLSQTLNISISTFASSYQKASDNKTHQPIKIPKETTTKLSSELKNKPIDQHSVDNPIQKKSQKESTPVAYPPSNQTILKTPQTSPITTVMQSPSHSQQQPQNKENEKFQGQPRKEKNRNKKESTTSAIPNVAMIFSAEIPISRFTSQQLRKKKQSLLRRKATQWNQKVKNRRDKREIRLLNN